VPEPSPDLKRASMEARELLRQTLDLWFPRCVVSEGGFHQAFARDWSPLPEATRFQVYQSRLVWVAAVGAEEFPERREEFEGYVRHGLCGFAQQLSDTVHGGSHWQIELTGSPCTIKRTYGIAFELFAHAAAGRLLGELESTAFLQLESLHDETYLGWIEESANDWMPTDFTKVFNTHLHLFEAILEWAGLAASAPESTRLNELVAIFEGPMATSDGRMIAHFGREWNPISDDWEIGHDLEAAYLLLDSGLGDPEKALKTIDFALANGWDEAHGGFFHLGNARGEIVDDTKVWWTQFEGLNALISAWQGTGGTKYETAILRLWAWIRDRQWDREYGGTFASLTREGDLIGDGQKAEPWKACYHDVRAFRSLSRCGLPRR
jgi:cellobiose epimerase